MYDDLLPILQAADDCPYMANNMHWQVSGHILVADDLSQLIMSEAIASRQDEVNDY